MTTLMQASTQWRNRPDDERFASLTDLDDFCQQARSHSRGSVVSSRRLEARPVEGDPKALAVVGPGGNAVVPTHWAFGQLAQRAGAPAGYLRELPSPLAADCINYGLKHGRDVEDLGVLLYKNGGAPELRAVTGPNYGRIWNADITRALVQRFGDGVSGHWRVPGEFGKRIDVTKKNTTLFASDRDMFVFLADEDRRIEMKNRRDGKAGSLARGFFVWNSEVGKSSWGWAQFVFDYMCCNRMIWGAEQFEQVRGIHSAKAPDRWLEEVAPVLEAYSQASAEPVIRAIEAAQRKKLDDVDTFLKQRFGANLVTEIKAVHMLEEQRPIETLWDAATAVTAYARELPHQDKRVDLEREAGKLLSKAA